MKQTLNPVNSIINFMYFANNFSIDQVKQMLSTTSAPGHILDKFNTYCDRRKNGTDGLFDLFMQLSSDNQKAICKWVNENYLAFKHLAEKQEELTKEEIELLRDNTYDMIADYIDEPEQDKWLKIHDKLEAKLNQE